MPEEPTLFDPPPQRRPQHPEPGPLSHRFDPVTSHQAAERRERAGRVRKGLERPCKITGSPCVTQWATEPQT